MQNFVSDLLKNNPYLDLALRHSSLGEQNYERMEFLGDRVLSLIIAQYLYDSFPSESEGDLAKRHTALVNGEHLAEMARKAGLSDDIQCSEAERLAGGCENDHILADVMESVIAAVYLDKGYDTAREMVEWLWGDTLKTMKEPPQDSKTALQEWTQANNLGLPEYEVVGQDGPDHAPLFTIAVHVKGYESQTATASSKRLAQKEAAQKMLSAVQVE